MVRGNQLGPGVLEVPRIQSKTNQTPGSSMMFSPLREVSHYAHNRQIRPVSHVLGVQGPNSNSLSQVEIKEKTRL